jgi:hypothetical protein
MATWTAARDFPHKLVAMRPVQSGDARQKAIVTQSEMLEHAFLSGFYVQALGPMHFAIKT